MIFVVISRYVSMKDVILLLSFESYLMAEADRASSYSACGSAVHKDIASR